MRQTKKERKMEEKHKNMGNKRGNIYIYISLSNTHFSLIYYINRNILIFLLISFSKTFYFPVKVAGWNL